MRAQHLRHVRRKIVCVTDVRDSRQSAKRRGRDDARGASERGARRHDTLMPFF